MSRVCVDLTKCFRDIVGLIYMVQATQVCLFQVGLADLSQLYCVTHDLFINLLWYV